MDSSSPDLLKQAVRLINLGDTERAQDLLLKTVIKTPSCIEAWLWLSELASTLEEQTAMLEEAMKRIPPGSSKSLQDYLAGLHNSPALPASQAAVAESPRSGQFYLPGIKDADDGYQQATKLLAAGKRADTLQLLYQLVSNGAHEERFWWMISNLEPGLESKIAALLWVTELNPGNAEARQRLRAFETMRNQPLSVANFFASIGETEQALDMYRELASKETDPEHKHELDQLIAALRSNPSQSAAGQKSGKKLPGKHLTGENPPSNNLPGKSLLGFVRSIFS